ncbi:hypothetical protein HJFPF1_01206 [Paramyrothecium foliicola]|nr:hypothetical protein HJFPF1_01206 [Paramyrothecium foliicola]
MSENWASHISSRTTSPKQFSTASLSSRSLHRPLTSWETNFESAGLWTRRGPFECTFIRKLQPCRNLLTEFISPGLSVSGDTVVASPANHFLLRHRSVTTSHKETFCSSTAIPSIDLGKDKGAGFRICALGATIV